MRGREHVFLYSTKASLEKGREREIRGLRINSFAILLHYLFKLHYIDYAGMNLKFEVDCGKVKSLMKLGSIDTYVVIFQHLI